MGCVVDEWEVLTSGDSVCAGVVTGGRFGVMVLRLVGIMDGPQDIVPLYPQHSKQHKREGIVVSVHES